MGGTLEFRNVTIAPMGEGRTVTGIAIQYGDVAKMPGGFREKWLPGVPPSRKRVPF